MLKKTCTLLGIWVLCTLVPNLTHAQYWPPTNLPTVPIPDLIVTKMTVQSIVGNVCTFVYEVKNVGTRSMDLSPLEYYLSVGSTPVSSTPIDCGSGLLSTTTFTLGVGQTYTETAIATAPAQVNIDQYHYLTFYAKPRPGYGSQEMNVANNSLTIDISYADAAFEISDFSIMDIHKDTISFWYTIHNTGTRPLYLNRFTMKTFVSTDSILNTPPDLQASTLIFNGYPMILPGASYSSVAHAATNVDLRVYNYLVANISLTPGQTHPYLSNNFALADVYLPASFPDVTISGVQVDSMIADRLEYHAYMQNTGGSQVDWNQYDVLVYLSRDNTLQADTDLVIATHPFIISNQVAVGSFVAPVSLYDYPYLILQLHLKSTTPDPYNYDSTANDWGAFYVPTSFPDLAVTDVEITNNFGNGVAFNYTVEAPQRSIHLEYLEYETYFSMDDVYDASDIPGDTRVFTNHDALVGGAYTFSDTSSSHANISTLDYPYLIFIAKSISGPYYESDYTNNQLVVSIPFFLKRPFKLPLTTHRFKLAQDNDNVTVASTSEHPQNNSYLLYSLNGEKISEGNFLQEKEINTTALKNGLYMLRLNDESQTETIKFVVQH
ncbi:MAG: hypothetical protein JWO58_2385 [Chitinophagaceae bacterium]|nr:hypothetical protein [Chitinophagaceae bacterium]